MIVFCRHGSDPGEPRPCPFRCPSQSWPRWLFDGQTVKSGYASYLAEVAEYDRLWRAYADQFPDGRYHGEAVKAYRTHRRTHRPYLSGPTRRSGNREHLEQSFRPGPDRPRRP
jgi:hypothetical protein